MKKIWPSVAVAALLFSGCVITEETVEVFDNGPRNREFLGFTTVPSSVVNVQALTDTGKTRTDPTATWATIASAVSSAAPAATSGGVDYYSWQVWVPPGGGGAWPRGGVERLRIMYDVGSFKTGYTFDNIGCIYSDPSLTWLQRATACAGHSNGYLHYVDASRISPSSIDYISRRETPKQFFMGNVVDNPAEDYYNNIDPRPDPNRATDRETLLGFRIVNGFLSSVGYEPEINARYFNKGDLELGRDMNCVKKAFSDEAACYVTNYGDPNAFRPRPGDDPHASILATINRDSDALVATVAMEYRGVSGPDNVTFYAYNADGDRVEDVELDFEGLKTIPGACLSCHGGTYDDATAQVTGSRFLPFDTDNFSYSTTVGWRLSDQQDEFRALNKLVYNTNSTDAIKELIDGWYDVGGGSDLSILGPDQDPDFVPPGWAGEELLYSEVVKPYCRGCHAGVFDGMGSLAFNEFSGFEAFRFAISNAVCETRQMPHAQVTRINFWKSAARGHLIGRLNLPTACD